MTIFNRPNRRVRTRTHGGVTGKAGDRLPMSIKALRAAISGYIVALVRSLAPRARPPLLGMTQPDNLTT